MVLYIYTNKRGFRIPLTKAPTQGSGGQNTVICMKLSTPGLDLVRFCVLTIAKKKWITTFSLRFLPKPNYESFRRSNGCPLML